MMPMSGPWWFDELPEYMTEADYRGLPEEVSRTIEIVHGHLIKCESPTPRHNRIARRLANALEVSRSPAGPCGSSRSRPAWTHRTRAYRLRP
jgi:hypothetical protein